MMPASSREGPSCGMEIRAEYTEEERLLESKLSIGQR